MIRYAWLQKHATPTASDGAFHWHPARGDDELRARLVERARGLEPPAVVWELAPDRVVWAQLFAAIAPHDRRRYTGVVLAIAERPGASALELLDVLALPSPAPRGDAVDARAFDDASRVAVAALAPADLAPLARSLLGGAEVHDALAPPVFAVLPTAVRALERAMPAATRGRLRRGAWFAVAADTGRNEGTRIASAVTRSPAGGARTVDPAGDPIALLVARACLAPGSRAARAWTMVCELAAHSGVSVDVVASDVWPKCERDDLARALHAWGRGARDQAGADADAVAADMLIVRIIADLVMDRDPSPRVAAARWHALLPSDRRALLFELAVRRCPSLRALLDIMPGRARA